MCVTCVTYISVRVRASTTMQTHTHMRNISWWVKKKKEKKRGEEMFSFRCPPMISWPPALPRHPRPEIPTSTAAAKQEVVKLVHVKKCWKSTKHIWRHKLLKAVAVNSWPPELLKMQKRKNNNNKKKVVTHSRGVLETLSSRGHVTSSL